MSKNRAGQFFGKSIGDLGEEALIDTFIAPIAHDIGDDVARIRPPADHDLLVSCDALVEGIHFLRESPPGWVGEKALRVNISDIAASGGRPKWCTLALSLPGSLEVAWLAEFSRGLGESLASAKMRLIGGDITASPRDISLTITIFGLRKDPEVSATVMNLTRTGAQPGQLVVVTGFLGETLPGLQAIIGERKLPAPVAKHWLKRHFFPPNRVDFAQAAYQMQKLSAMMDLSDGLVIDLARLTRASGVGATIDLDRIPISSDFSELGYSSAEAVLAGEDYELLFTLEPAHFSRLETLAKKSGVPISVIGKIQADSEVVFTQEGRKINLGKKAWQHFHGNDVSSG